MTSQLSVLRPSSPAHRPTVARLTGVKRRGRNVRRSQLLCSSGFTAYWCSACPAPTPHPRRNQVGPEARSLGHRQHFKSSSGASTTWCGGLDGLALAQVAPGGGHGDHAGAAAGLHRRAGRRRRRRSAPGRRPAPRRLSSGAGAASNAAWCRRRSATAGTPGAGRAQRPGSAKARRLVGDDAPGRRASSGPAQAGHRTREVLVRRHAGVEALQGTRRSSSRNRAHRANAEVQRRQHPRAPEPTIGPDAPGATAAGRARAHSLPVPARSGALSISVPSRSNSTASKRGGRSCLLPAGDEQLTLVSAGQP